MKNPASLLRWVYYAVVRFLIQFLLGRDIRHRDRLPVTGPAILVANHNSHIDTMVLVTLFPLHRLRSLRPVAAADYFLRSRLLSWFATEVVGIIALDRGLANARATPLQPAFDALARGDILILFPEGTRGVPEEIAGFKAGVAHLAERFPEVPVFPILLRGLGKTLPKGTYVPVPFTCQVNVGSPMYFAGSKKAFMQTLRQSFDDLTAETRLAPWE